MKYLPYSHFLIFCNIFWRIHQLNLLFIKVRAEVTQYISTADPDVSGAESPGRCKPLL